MEDSAAAPAVKQEPNGRLTSPRKRSKAADDVGASPSKKAKSEPKTGADGERKTGAWSKAEDKLLFEQIWQKATNVNWNQVSGQIEGRDWLSCRNRSKQLAKNLERFFMD